MMFYYRDDIFTQLGLTVPTTWDEYAATARALHTADPSKFLGTFSANDAGWFAGLVAAGAGRVVVDRRRRLERRHRRGAHPAGRRLLGRPRRGGRHRQQADVHPRVERGPERRHAGRLARRRVGPGCADAATPPTPPDSGRPRRCRTGARMSRTATGAARRPAVTSQSKNVDAAVEFATWLNTDPEAVQALVTETGIYPASTAGRGIRAHRGAGVLHQPARLLRRRRRGRPGRRAVPVRPERERHVQRLQRRVREGRRGQVAPGVPRRRRRDAADHRRRPGDERLHRRRSSAAPARSSQRRGAYRDPSPGLDTPARAGYSTGRPANARTETNHHEPT